MTQAVSIGLIANEFRPSTGGMELYIERVAEGFAQLGADVHIFIRQEAEALDHITCHKALTGDLGIDLDVLRRYPMDIWLSNNASHLILARYHKHVSSLIHGNDFLNPWVTHQYRHLDGHLLWRFRKVLIEKRLDSALRKALPKIQKLFFNSTFTRELFEKRFPVREEQAIIAHPGVDEDFLAAPIKREDSGGPFRMLTVSRLTAGSRRKNIDGVLLAVAELKDAYDIRYTIVGHGDDLERLKQLAQDLDVGDVVEFKGRIERAELIVEYSRSDLFVLTPHNLETDIEGFGIAFLEANAEGLPVMSTRGNGSRDAIVEGVTGIFVEDGSVEEIASGLKKFLDRTVHISPQNCREHACKYAWEKTVTRIYREIMASYDTSIAGRSVAE